MAEDTARTVEKVEVRKAYKFGGETISFSKEEMAKIRSFGDPVLRIIGFKPLSMLPSWASWRPSTFIYPSEEEVIGSTRVFSALQQKLVKDQKMGLAWFVARRNATPALAVILPGEEKVDEEGFQTMPPGLWVHPLPFADDVRQPPEVSVVRSPDQLIDMMRTVIQQLQLPKAIYDPHKHPNPSLQWFYRILQALALDEDLPEKPEDKTIPRYRQIDKRAGQYVLDWGNELEAQFRLWQKENAGSKTATGASKRGTTSGTAKLETKKTKVGEGDAMSDDEMRKHFQKNSIGKLTVAVLKSWVQTKGMKPAGKKAEIVDQITAYFETKMEVD